VPWIRRRHHGRRLFRLRTILLSFTLMVLLIPLGSLYLFRLFEDELVLRTELELISQSAVLAALYKQQVMALDPNQGKGYGLSLPPQPASDEFYQPIKPILSLSAGDPLPKRPDSLPTPLAADPLALQIGERLQPILRHTQRVMLAGMRVLDWQGVVIAGRDEVGRSLAHVDEVARAMQGQYAANIRQRISDEPPPALTSISRGTRIRLFSAFPVIHGQQLLGVIYLSRTPENILKFLHHEKQRVIWPTLVILLATLLLAALLSSRIVRPIKLLIRQTERVAGGDDGKVEPIATPGTHELAQLSESFAHMANSLNERSRYIEQFASHVSHEFKTPLTAMQGALELLLDHDDMTEQQRQRFLNNLLSDTERLKALVTRLLELARADNLQAGSESADLAPILSELQQTFAERGLTLALPEQPADITLAIAPDALRTSLHNLLSNSLEHGATRVDIAITRQHGDRITLTLQDNGKGISAANRERIFTPFFTTRREQGGTGLGLGIVASLLKAHQGEIELGESSQGARFLLTIRAREQVQNT
jgi:signal transduction histidine kinase